MRKRDIVAGLGILAVFGLGALLVVVIAPNFLPHEGNFPGKTPVDATGEALLPATLTAVPPTFLPVTATPALPTPPETASPTASATAPATGRATVTATAVAVTVAPVKPTPGGTATGQNRGSGQAAPPVTQQPFSLPGGLGPSEGARSCPQPLPVENIRKNYLAYWDALQQAYKTGNPDLLAPYVDTTAQDGKYWQGKHDAIVKSRQGGYWIDYRIEHTSSAIIVKINPYYGNTAGECQISVFDGVRLTGLAKKIGSDEPFDSNRATPQVQEYKQSHSFEMNLKDGRWLLGGEGAGEL